MNKGDFRKWYDSKKRGMGTTNSEAPSEVVKEFPKGQAMEAAGSSNTPAGFSEDSGSSAPSKAEAKTRDKAGSEERREEYELTNSTSEAELIRLYTALKQRHDQLIRTAGLDLDEYDTETAKFWNTLLEFHLQARKRTQGEAWIKNKLKDNCFSKILDKMLQAIALQVKSGDLDRFADSAEWRAYRSVYPTTARPLI